MNYNDKKCLITFFVKWKKYINLLWVQSKAFKYIFGIITYESLNIIHTYRIFLLMISCVINRVKFKPNSNVNSLENFQIFI